VNLFARYAARLRPLAPGEVEPDTIRGLVRAPSIALYGVGIGISLLFPASGVISYLASAVARGLPTDAIRRALGRA
jgi:hypothetical protein